MMYASPLSAEAGKRLIRCIVPVLLLVFSTVLAQAQYSSIVVFGDSLSDVGNDAILTNAKYGPALTIPGPVADYTLGRFTDGADTLPPAQNYFGVWIEQLAAMMPGVPILQPSLAGGDDYAYGFATTGTGKGDFTFGPGDVYGVKVDNMGRQITSYLATHKKLDKKTLFVVWGGAINVLYASSPADVVEGALDEVADVQRLIDAGATQFLVPNLPPLGDVPRLNGSPTTSAPANAASVLFNETLESGLNVLPIVNFRHTVRIYELDTFALLTDVVASRSVYSLANVTSPSQGQPVDPDTYLFWDDLHPTTKGHNILALAALKLVDPSACMAMQPMPGEASCASIPTFGGFVQ